MSISHAECSASKEPQYYTFMRYAARISEAYGGDGGGNTTTIQRYPRADWVSIEAYYNPIPNMNKPTYIVEGPNVYIRNIGRQTQ